MRPEEKDDAGEDLNRPQTRMVIDLGELFVCMNSRAAASGRRRAAKAAPPTAPGSCPERSDLKPCPPRRPS